MFIFVLKILHLCLVPAYCNIILGWAAMFYTFIHHCILSSSKHHLAQYKLTQLVAQWGARHVLPSCHVSYYTTALYIIMALTTLNTDLFLPTVLLYGVMTLFYKHVLQIIINWYLAKFLSMGNMVIHDISFRMYWWSMSCSSAGGRGKN
jgi:hypothetical protein